VDEKSNFFQVLQFRIGIETDVDFVSGSIYIQMNLSRAFENQVTLQIGIHRT
jgi:hypothetical protein